MIHSMTGFGKADGLLADKKISIQVKSLNSKQSDVSVKVPGLFREMELDLRKQLAEELTRGKIELSLQYENLNKRGNHSLDKELLKNYVLELSELKEELSLNEDSLLSIAARFPEVLKNQSEELSADDKKAVMETVKTAIANIKKFREDEGKSLFQDLKSHVEQIGELLQQALVFEKERIEIVKERMKNNLEELPSKANYNEDRFEQELIYYMEKYDISEEKVRLGTHCDYFIETLNAQPGQGKKLGFITQEMGREINTLGSKSNHAEMQKCVVEMKDELEKIKEQVLNVL